MTFKLLLLGKNMSVIKLFFDLWEDTFKVMTSSLIRQDAEAHVNLFRPDGVVYALGNETKDEYDFIKTFGQRLRRKGIPLVLIAKEGVINDFQRDTGFVAANIISLPKRSEGIYSELYTFMKEYVKERGEMADLDDAPEETEFQEEMKEKVAETVEAAPEEKKAESAGPKKVLIIDDDPLMLKTVKQQLGNLYECATAISGKIAYRYLETRTADLILLDYEMPGENGPEVMEHIRIMGGFEDTPIIFMTGVTDREKIAKALKLKPQGYVLKPIEGQKLRETIANCLGN